jgi:branched-chain amino acid transport system substrate-binding protein
MLGYEYWKESVDAKGGIIVGDDVYRVEFSYLDTESVNNNASTCVKILAETCNFIFGPYGTGANEQAAKAAKEINIPLITASAAGKVVYDTGSPWVCGLLPPASGYLPPVLEIYLKQEPPPKTYVIIASTDGGAQQDASNTENMAKNNGLQNKGSNYGEIPGFRFEKGLINYDFNQNFSINTFTKLAEVLAKDVPDLILVACRPEGQFLVNALQQAKVTPKGLALSVGPSLGSFVGTNIAGGSPWLDNDTTFSFDRWGSAKNFATAFISRYNMKADYISCGGYSCGIVLELALQKAGIVNREKVMDELLKIDTTLSYGPVKINLQPKDGGVGQNLAKKVVPIQLQHKHNPDRIEAIELKEPKDLLYPFKWDQ